MALRTFETADAKYYLGLGNHFTSSAPIFEDIDLEKLDFLVLEGDGSTFRSPSDIFALPQYAEFEELQQQFHFPIYLVDLGTLPETDSARVLTSVLSESPVYFLGAHLFSKSIKRGKDKTKMSRRELFRRVGQGMVGTALFSP